MLDKFERYFIPYKFSLSSLGLLYLLLLSSAGVCAEPILSHVDATPVASLAPHATAATKSSKRGLIAIFHDNPYQDTDNLLLSRPKSGLTWYYNYYHERTEGLVDSTHLDFVPMLTGPPGDGFADSITSQISNGVPIKHILFLNEPDGCEGGGVCLSPQDAVSIWNDQIIPLKEKYPDLLVSCPAVTGSSRGLFWLQNFFGYCETDNGNPCKPDFLALHWYGASDGLISWTSQMREAFAHNSTTGDIWVTEFGYPFASDQDTLAFFNESVSYLDSQQDVTRYSYFGSFRSGDSNIGPSAAMIDDVGRLTQLGALYANGIVGELGPNVDSNAASRPESLSFWLFSIMTAASLSFGTFFDFGYNFFVSF